MLCCSNGDEANDQEISTTPFEEDPNKPVQTVFAPTLEVPGPDDGVLSSEKEILAQTAEKKAENDPVTTPVDGTPTKTDNAPAAADDSPEKKLVEAASLKLQEIVVKEAEEASPKDIPREISLASRTKGGPVIIILVNPKSGGNAAGALLKLPEDGIHVALGNGSEATCFSYPIADPEKRGIKHLADEVSANLSAEPVRCIVAGGDGTVMWAIEEIFKSNIAINRVHVGTMPFGTGNDFGNVTKWGVQGPPKGFLKEKNDFKGLHKYVHAWLRAETRPFDIWEISVKTRSSPKAGFRFIDKREKKCTEDHMKRHHIKTLPGGEFEMSKYVCNYVGFGLDAHVGVGFDKNRMGNRFLNKAVYAYEGVKKLFFHKKSVIGHIMDNMRTIEAESTSAASDGHDRSLVPDAETVFTTSTDTSEPRLLGNPVGLLFLNIPSLAGGLDVWGKSTHKKGTSSTSQDLMRAQQDFGDGRLECLSYRTGLGFYAEQVRVAPIAGQGNRVYSGAGPLRISFRNPEDEKYVAGTAHCKGRTYMQVDGEFIIVHEPDTVVIKHHATVTVLVSIDGGGCCG
eukprot:TRINITY_DN11946_c0_g1_i1.p1 TRINITY_DN11946_c0_g1~~TRINITY_DN11946_c0_g1_i1.p1  ORF type:complete len:568 (+),score=112.95 TRINITY_DN11946_c0_g1_i1:117-1820(+)